MVKFNEVSAPRTGKSPYIEIEAPTLPEIRASLTLLSKAYRKWIDRNNWLALWQSIQRVFGFSQDADIVNIPQY